MYGYYLEEYVQEEDVINGSILWYRGNGKSFKVRDKNF